MKVVKKTPEYTVYEKRSRRFAVMGADKKWVNGEDKVKILVQEKLIEVKMPAPTAEEPEEVAAEATEATETEAAAEEAPAEEAPAEEAPAEEAPAEEAKPEE